MRCSHGPTRPCRAVGRLRWLIAAFVGLIAGLDAEAASLLKSPGFDAAAHAFYCKCGDTCAQDSCCCSPKEPSKPKARPSGRWRNPCVTSAPCHDSGLPVAGSSYPIGKSATIVPGIESLARDHHGTRFRPPGRAQLPPRRASRLDRPPDCIPAS